MSTIRRPWPSSTACCRACPSAGRWPSPRAASRRCDACRGCAPQAWSPSWAPPTCSFTRDEALALLSSAGVEPAAAEALYRRTMGWPAGLRLALGGARGAGPGSAIDRQAFDFLSSEVLAQLDDGLREFLLQTSVLHELDAAAMRGADRRSAGLGPPRRAGAAGPLRHRGRRRPAHAEAARPVPRHAAPPPAARTPGRA